MLIDVSVLKEWVENWFTKNRLYHPYAKNNNIPITELYDILEQMPSAQPEIIRCKDCKHWGTMDGKSGRCYAEHYDEDIGFYKTTMECGHEDFCSWAERREERI